MCTSDDAAETIDVAVGPIEDGTAKTNLEPGTVE